MNLKSSLIAKPSDAEMFRQSGCFGTGSVQEWSLVSQTNSVDGGPVVDECSGKSGRSIANTYYWKYRFLLPYELEWDYSPAPPLVQIDTKEITYFKYGVGSA